MRLPLFLSVLTAASLAVAVWARPIPVGPPAMVDGKPVVMPIVKKWGQYWYPASLVGHNMGVEFSFDHATNTLYVDGSRLDLDTVVVDGVVYLPLKPRLSSGGLQPGEEMLKLRRHEYEALEASAPERVGNTEAMFMHTEVDVPAHPWEQEDGDPQTFGPVIDLDPSGEVIPVPGTMRPQEAPKPLPNRVSRIPAPPAPPQDPPQGPGSGGSIPTMVATQGGPQGRSPVALAPVTNVVAMPQVSPTGLQPIPGGVPGSITISPREARNQTFGVALLDAQVRTSGSGRTFAIKIRQTNLSPVAQANLGSYLLRCADGRSLEPVQSRSVLSSSTLAPGGSREGELVFQMTTDAVPASLELKGPVPLSVDLLMQ